jgi:hypothetical protein
MPKISDEPLEAIQARLFKSDLDYLRSLYSGSLGVNKAIRQIVRSFVTHTKAEANKAIDETEKREEENLL